MADENAGAVFTQSGVPVRGSADYQRVYDSRWRFIELELEYDFEVTLPASPVGPVIFEKTTVVKHGLGFVPFFEGTFEHIFYDDDFSQVSLFADKERVFIKRIISIDGAISRTITGTVRVYNLPILEEYVAPKGIPQGSSSPRGPAGVKFLDGNKHGVDIGDNSPVGFSVDSSKKILSIHRHGLVKINDFIGKSCDVTAINTTTDVLTVSASANPFDNPDISWLQEPGAPIRYFPDDFVTFPGGMIDDTYFIIPVDATHVKLAASYQNALNGVAVNLTTTGSLPGGMNKTANPSVEENTILHDVGYPPTYILARVSSDDEWLTDDSELYIGPMITAYTTMVEADDRVLRLTGVQAVAADWLGYIILKDPAEIAR